MFASLKKKRTGNDFTITQKQAQVRCARVPLSWLKKIFVRYGEPHFLEQVSTLEGVYVST